MPLKATLLIFGLSTVAVTNALGSGEISKFIDFVAFFGGVAGYFLIAERYPLKKKDVFVFTATVLISGVILEVTGAPGTRGEFGLIPFSGESWKVLIKSPHFTGWGGLFFLFVSLLLSQERGWGLRYFQLFLIGWYLIIFSGSRSSIAAALAAVALWFSGTARRMIMRSPYLGVLITFLAGLSMYLAPIVIFESLRTEGFLGRLLKISPGQEDVTAGRFLTWLYHLELFFENFWTGAETSMVTEAGDTVGRELTASNESFFTKVLAKHGVFGILFHFLFLFISWYSIDKKSYEAYILSVVFAIITAASGVFGSTYYVYSVLGYWLFFSLVFLSSDRS
ncbi:hypothetical protein [Salinibacter grassmerensis]|uniref:hypothetical protein n=1 Tax=Salinibacter grassmerensis TaxID=3040353 RepID=UPI0021E97565|nr:hypothetical protein [Salinibacter grassmerensis]